jgi:ubiquinone biosynthesis protein COQ4
MTLTELRRVVVATARVIADSTRTDELLVAEQLVCRGRFQHLYATLSPSDEGAALLYDKPSISSADVDFDALRTLPVESLGGAYVRHLDRYGLDADVLAVPVTTLRHPDVRYLHERYRQTHDIWHALLGLGTEGHEEVLVHAFTWAQLGLPYSAMILLFGTVKHMVLEQRWEALRNGLRDAYMLGRKAEPLLLVYWERHWETPLAEVRANLGLGTLH